MRYIIDDFSSDTQSPILYPVHSAIMNAFNTDKR